MRGTSFCRIVYITSNNGQNIGYGEQLRSRHAKGACWNREMGVDDLYLSEIRHVIGKISETKCEIAKHGQVRCRRSVFFPKSRHSDNFNASQSLPSLQPSVPTRQNRYLMTSLCPCFRILLRTNAPATADRRILIAQNENI